MLTFKFLFVNSIGTLNLEHSDNISKSKSLQQHDTITAAEGQQLAKLTIDVLITILKEDKFQSFYDRVLHLILMHQLFLAKDMLLGGSILD